MLTEDSSLSDNSLTTLSAFLPTAVISLRDVSYSYPTRSEYLVLRNITMTFRMQSIHVIIGKNGSGKSTLLSILCGLYTPSTGEVNTCGSGSSFPSSKLSLDWVRENIGVVEQSAKLFSGTIRENICYGSQVRFP